MRRILAGWLTAVLVALSLWSPVCTMRCHAHEPQSARLDAVQATRMECCPPRTSHAIKMGGQQNVCPAGAKATVSDEFRRGLPEWHAAIPQNRAEDVLLLPWVTPRDTIFTPRSPLPGRVQAPLRV